MTEEEHNSTCNNENEEFYLKLKSEAEDVLQKVCSCLYVCVCVCVCVSISERERERERKGSCSSHFSKLNLVTVP